MDSGLKHLEGRKQLKTLNSRNCANITDDGITKLKKTDDSPDLTISSFANSRMKKCAEEEKILFKK